MFRAIVKATSLRQAASELEAHGLGNLVERVLHYGQFDQWISDIIAAPGDPWVRDRLTAWAAANTASDAFINGYGFRPGTLLYWCEMDDTLLDLKVHARKAVDDMIATQAVQG